MPEVKEKRRNFFSDKIESQCLIDGINFNQLEPTDKITMITKIMKSIIESTDEQDRISLERAKQEKSKAEKVIGKMKDELAQAEKTILMHQDDKTVISKKFYGHWNDTRYCIDRFMKVFFGADMTTYLVSTFFGPMPVPPQYEAIQVGPDPEDTIQVPKKAVWTLPIPTAYHCSSKEFGKIDSEKISLGQNPDNPVEAELFIETTKRRKFFWENMFQRMMKFATENSIFKGKVINSQFQFIHTHDVKWDDVILHPKTKDEVKVALEFPIKYRDHLLAAKMQFKRGVLLSGKYGVGKTMLAKAMANSCSSIGITFLMVRSEDIENLSNMYRIAGHYSPAVLFCEDVDRIVGIERTQEADYILNILDGVHKVGEIMTIFTTNHISNINPALQRPGRIDDIITIGPADDEGRLRLIARTIADSSNFCDDDIVTRGEEIAKATSNFPGSFIIECVKSATQRAVLRNAEAGITPEEINENGITINADDLLYGANKLTQRAEEYAKLDPSKLPTVAIGGSAMNGLLAALLTGAVIKKN